VNDLFEGELTDQDKLVYVNNVIMGKLLESETLKQQATNNTKEQLRAWVPCVASNDRQIRFLGQCPLEVVFQ
jgi:hypothetical protein